MLSIDTTPVADRADDEALHEIWWRGRQWAVTEYGIEAVDGSYPIKKDVLLENLHDRSWLLQMGEKVWVDMNEFATAFMVALVMHGYSPADANVLKRQLDSVEKERKGDLGGDDN